ncbi:MAG: STAS domain-containing protein [Actinomycetota bacterium]|nr:STAS domain-containing protein [Actinomycetota bacterium]
MGRRPESPKSAFHAGTPDGPYVRLGAGGSLAISGEIDCATSGFVESALVEAFKQADVRLLDLTGLTFADVSGMRVIAAAAQTIKDAHGRVQIRGASSTFRRLWLLLKLGEAISADFVGEAVGTGEAR